MSLSNGAPQPPPTPKNIFEHGTPILIISGPRSQTIEDWVQTIAKLTGTQTDWRLIGGRAIVLVLGDKEACQKILTACYDHWEALVDSYMQCPYNFTQNPERRDVQCFNYHE